jgi:hypothetical protein
MSTLTTSSATYTLRDTTLYIPPAGGWRADIVVDESTTLPSGDVTLKIGDDLMFVGKVERATFDLPDHPHAIVVGGLGWKSLVTKPISFQSDGGVRLSTVLNAIARAAGQVVELPQDATIGDYYEIVASRPAEPVRWIDVLNDLTRGGFAPPWRVDPDGVTRFGARTPLTISTRATIVRIDATDGARVYKIDAPGQWLPGNTTPDGITIGRVKIHEKRKGTDIGAALEAMVWPAGGEGAAAPTIREQVRRLVGLAMADMVRTYVVAAVESDGRMDLVPPPDSPHLPELRKIRPWVIGGIQYVATPGERVTVMFRDERKTRPIVIGTELSAGPFAGVARLGDTVTVLLPPATFSGTINGLPASGVVVWSTQTLGNISTSSAKTKAGP